MRFSYILLLTSIAIFASCDAVFAETQSDQKKLMIPDLVASTNPSHRLLRTAVDYFPSSYVANLLRRDNHSLRKSTFIGWSNADRTVETLDESLKAISMFKRFREKKHANNERLKAEYKKFLSDPDPENYRMDS